MTTDSPPAADIDTLYATAMRQAIDAARANGTIFGAALVDEAAGTVPYCAANRRGAGTTFAHDSHDTMVVLKEAIGGGADLTRLTLVSTTEPCPACASAAVLAELNGIVFGTSIQALVELGWRQIVINAATVSEAYTRKPVPVRGGVLVDETDELSRSVPARG